VAQYDEDQDGALSAAEFDKMMQEMKPQYIPDGMLSGLSIQA